ncbi:MAG: L-seryl-tRNA(Sec) selenium transferase [Acidimicrobiia bacterium]
MTNPYRALPAVEELADRLDDRLPRPLLVDIARATLDRARRDIGDGREVDVTALGERMVRAVLESAGRRVINATGVLLHTNLGRAPWSERASTRAREIAVGYSNVELDLGTGERGRRGGYVSALLRSLTGAEDAMVVNNNAAAVLLSLATLAAGRAVPVARGELIEIGGAYRLPEVVAASGALLVEVGTTNRTRSGDYETALQLHRCSAILKVHPSNYRVEGFTEEAGIEELAHLATKHQVPLIYDIGSGLLDADMPWLRGDRPRWLADEPAARQSLQAGAGLVLFSGDKLLGGPQAGVIVGDAALVGHLRSHPLARALRPDAVTLAALAATLEAYADGALDEIPFWRMALTSYDDLEERAASLAKRLHGKMTEGHSVVGGGSAPGALIPSPLATLDGEDHLYEALLAAQPPVLTRREEGALIIDLRCVDQAADHTIVSTVLACR